MREKFPTLDEVQVGISLLSMKINRMSCAVGCNEDQLLPCRYIYQLQRIA